MKSNKDIPVASQPVSPRQGAFSIPSPDSSQESAIFDKPLPIETSSQPSRNNHVKWDISLTPPSKKTLIIASPFSEIKVDANIISNFPREKSTEAIEDIVRGLSKQPRINSSPVGSDDEENSVPIIPDFTENDDYLNEQNVSHSSSYDELQSSSFISKSTLDAMKPIPFSPTKEEKSFPEPFPSPPTEQVTPSGIFLSPIPMMKSINESNEQESVTEINLSPNNEKEENNEEMNKSCVDELHKVKENEEPDSLGANISPRIGNDASGINSSPIHVTKRVDEKMPKTPPNESFSSLFFAQPKNVFTYDDLAPSETEIKFTLREFEESGKVPSKEKIVYVERYLEEKRVDSITSGQYLDADKYENTIKEMRIAMIKSIHESEIQSKVQPFLDRLEEAKNQLFTEENSWSRKLETAKNKCYLKLQDFDKLQDEELRKFDEKWDDPNYLRIYSKPSSQLNQLRKIEKKLVLTKRYADADEVRKRIDIMEMEETEAMQKRGIEDMSAQRNLLVEQQEVNRENFTVALKQKLSMMKKERDDALEAIKKKIAKLEKKIDEVRNEAIQWKPTTITSIVTPRASTQMAKFRNESYFKPLRIKPMNSSNVTPKKKKKIFVATAHVFDV